MHFVKKTYAFMSKIVIYASSCLSKCVNDVILFNSYVTLASE